MQLSQGNLGQALSLLIKKGIFCHPLGVEHGDKRWEETDHKHSNISDPSPQKRLFLSTIGLRCSVLCFHSLRTSLLEAKQGVKICRSVGVLDMQRVTAHLLGSEQLTLNKDFTQEIQIQAAACGFTSNPKLH